MQNVNTLVSRPVRFGTAAVSGLLAFAAGAEQIAHNRSEAGLGASNSVGAEQIAHNRAEKNL